MIELKGKYTTAKVMIDNVDEKCISQIIGFINNSSFDNPVAIMPDCHAGKGSVIGFTMPMSNKIIPEVIGVDIGCGMLSFCIGKDIGISLSDLNEKIRNVVPFGFDVNSNKKINMKNDFPYKETNEAARKFIMNYSSKIGVSDKNSISLPNYTYDWFIKKCNDINCNSNRAILSIGTIGGGNHFLELGKSQNTGDLWVTIHTGSRNFGTCVCDYWQKIAIQMYKEKNSTGKIKNEIEKIKLLYKNDKNKMISEIQKIQKECNKTNVPVEDLCYLEGNYAIQYLFDMIFSQMYAKINRKIIAKSVLKILGIDESLLDDDNKSIETIHNFIDFDDFIIRKGSIRSYVGEKMIIPFNMRDGLLICEGKSNNEWNCSAPHGAGRVMSRAEAKKTIDIENFKKQMSDIYSTSVVESTLDEAPDAYKNSAVIEKAIEPTATIIDRIKPLLNLKDCGKAVKDIDFI